MAKSVSNAIGEAAANIGKFIGKTEPSRETKFSWWQVYAYDGLLFACCYEGLDGNFVLAEEIEASELSLYVDDYEKAKKLLEDS